MGYTIIGSRIALSTDGSSVSTVADFDTTGADLFLQFISCNANNEPTLVSDTKGNAYVPSTLSDHGGAGRMRVYECRGGTVGVNHGVIVNGNLPAVVFVAVSGSAASPKDQQNNAQSAFGLSGQPGIVNPTETDELVMTAISMHVAATASLGGGYAILQQAPLSSGAAFGIAVGYLIKTGSSSPENPTWNVDNANALEMIITTYKTVGGGGSPGVDQRLLLLDS